MTGRRLVDETIEFVTEYLESLYNIKKSNGKLKLQLEQRDCKKLEAQRGIVKYKYDDKMRNMADERRTSHSHNYLDDRNRDRGYKTSRNSDYKRDKFERKAPPEFSGKPCHVHGDKAKHTYEECRDNPKNRKSTSGNRNNNNRKRNHDAHYHDKRYLSSQDESPDDHRTPEPSDDEGTKSSVSRKDGQRDEENYHVDTGKIPQKKRKVGVVQRSASRKKDL